MTLFRLFIVAIVALGLNACEFVDVDKCLDAGGRWNYELKRCEFSESQGTEKGCRAPNYHRIFSQTSDRRKLKIDDHFSSFSS